MCSIAHWVGHIKQKQRSRPEKDCTRAQAPSPRIPESRDRHCEPRTGRRGLASWPTLDTRAPRQATAVVVSVPV